MALAAATDLSEWPGFEGLRRQTETDGRQVVVPGQVLSELGPQLCGEGAQCPRSLCAPPLSSLHSRAMILWTSLRLFFSSSGPSVTSLHEMLVRRGEQGAAKVGVMQDERRAS